MNPGVWLAAVSLLVVTSAVAGTRTQSANRTPSPGERVVGVDGSTCDARERSCPGTAPKLGASRSDRRATRARVGRRDSEEGGPPTPSAAANLLSDLDTLAARIERLDSSHLAPLCDAACLTGVESVTVKHGSVACRCRKVESLGRFRVRAP